MNKMKSNILLAPDSAPGAGAATPAPAAPAAIPAIPLGNTASGGGPPLTAKTSLGLDTSPKDELRRMTERLVAQQPKATPYTPAPPAIPAPAETPAAPAEPAPAAPAEPAPAPPAAPAAPAKIKVGGKEYSEAELEQLLKGPPQAPAPAPAPQPPAPAPQAPPPPTPEQLQAMEKKWVTDQSESFEPLVDLSEEEIEQVLSGGKDGVKALRAALKRTAAAAALHTRKSIYTDFDPAFKQFVEIQDQVTKLYGMQQAASAAAVEQRFFGTRADYSPHADLCRKAYVGLQQAYPNEVAQMTEDQLFDQIQRQVDYHLNGEFSRSLGFEVTDWKEIRRRLGAPASPAPAAVPAQIPTAPAASSAALARGPVATPFSVKQAVQVAAVSVPAASATPPAPSVFAPGGASVPTPGTPERDWRKSVIAGLQQ